MDKKTKKPKKKIEKVPSSAKEVKLPKSKYEDEPEIIGTVGEKKAMEGEEGYPLPEEED